MYANWKFASLPIVLVFEFNHVGRNLAFDQCLRMPEQALPIDICFAHGGDLWIAHDGFSKLAVFSRNEVSGAYISVSGKLGGIEELAHYPANDGMKRCQRMLTVRNLLCTYL